MTRDLTSTQKPSKAALVVVGFLLVSSVLTDLMECMVSPLGLGSGWFVAAIGRIAAVVLIARQGILTRSGNPFYRVLLVLIGLCIFGLLMKIMHWEGASLVLFAAVVPMPIVYYFHFRKKQVKTRLDKVKLVWVVLICMAIIFMTQHFLFRYQLKAIEGLWFLLLFFEFSYLQYRRPKVVG